MLSISMLCTQFYCNAPTHQESVWIHISVVHESVSFRDYTLPVKIDMSAPELACVAGPQFYGGPDLQRAGSAPARILPVANQAPHKTEGLPRRLPLSATEIIIKIIMEPFAMTHISYPNRKWATINIHTLFSCSFNRYNVLHFETMWKNSHNKYVVII